MQKEQQVQRSPGEGMFGASKEQQGASMSGVEGGKQQLKIRPETDWAAILSLIFFHILSTLDSSKRLLTRVLLLNVHNNKNLETVQVPITKPMDEQTVVYFYSPLSRSHQNE